MIEIHWYTVAAAFVLDFFLGDPARLPHPIVYMGRAISYFEPWFRKKLPHLLISGGIFAVSLILFTWIFGTAVIKVAFLFHPMLGECVQIILLFFCFSSKSLKKAAMKVNDALKKEDIILARKAVGMIVGRQTESLDKPAITRATIETVAENFVDGFLSPLFFACIGGVPAALAYKMINTLDSMVGYKNRAYLYFGRVAARIDDGANFIPARLSVIVISLAMAVFSKPSGIQALKTGFSQGRRHKSPNAGFPEAAFAGGLAIRLGGPSIYHGRVVEKPFLGDQFNDPEPFKIRQACDLMLLASFFATVSAGLILAVF